MENLATFWTVGLSILTGYTFTLLTWFKLNASIIKLQECNVLLEADIVKNTSRMDIEFSDHGKTNLAIQITLTEIKKDLEYIKKNLKNC